MERVKGKDAVIQIYDDGLTSYIPFLCSRTCNMELQANMLQVTDVPDGAFYNAVPQQKSGSMTGDGVAHIDNTLFGFDGQATVDIAGFILNDTKVQVRFKIANTESSPTEKYISAYGYFRQLKLTGTYNDVASYSYTIELVGEIIYS